MIPREGVRVCQSFYGSVQVLPSLARLVHRDLPRGRWVLILRTNHIRVVLVCQTFELVIHQRRIKVSVVFQMKELIGVEGGLTRVVLLHLDLDDFVRVRSPLANIADECHLDHPTDVGEVATLLGTRARA